METAKGTSRAKVIFALLVGSIVIVAGIVSMSYHSPPTTNSSTSTTTSQTSSTKSSASAELAYAVVREDVSVPASVTGQASCQWDLPCAVYEGNDPVCCVTLISYQGSYYYLDQIDSSGRVYTAWLTNSTVYCATPVSGSFPECPTASGTSSQTFGPGPISTYPRSWADPCGYLVQGNATTGLYIGNMSNANLSQIYSIIVNSSAFQTLADGRTWVTVEWDVGNSGNPQAFVDGDFLFIQGGLPDINAYATVQYQFESGKIAVFIGLYYTPCPQGTNYGDYAHLIGQTQEPYAVGQPIGINFTVGDDRVTNMTITSSTSCLADFIVVQSGYEPDGFPTNGPVVYHSAENPGCTGPPLKAVLNPGQTYFQTVEWNQTDDSGAQVPPGNYEIIGMEAGYLGQLFPVSLPLIIGNQTMG